MNELRQYQFYHKQKNSLNINLSKGEIVLIKDDNPQPRQNWKKGAIEELVVGRDGKTRGVKLVVFSRTGRRTTCYRPLQKIIPLEIADDRTREVEVDKFR